MLPYLTAVNVVVITVSSAKSASIEVVLLALNHDTARPFVGALAIGKRCPLANSATMMSVTVSGPAMIVSSKRAGTIG